MKKIFIFLGLMFVMLSSTYAQKGRQAIGFGLSYGTEIESAGLGIKYQYNITNPLRIEPSFNYFFENDNVSMLDLNVNFHYLCPVAQSVKLYPLFGLTMSNWSLTCMIWMLTGMETTSMLMMGVTIMNSVSGLISELGRNSLWDVTGL